ncbi:hypothetical protein A3G06_01660 [Candidatus Nomurabacteria bacterium RIFCSPLOWO2_12_FULL_46_14]|uniref:Uncharacterized protein n=1 Tax=Candidatus Nomurabacteria bacterium RIFCSPLOWO2_12_FULL_46_14 TaxID=1801797 RepID=A0A1F6Y9Q3_9BACT|nr:MAG: hypothetical protein A3G06_01660 [Candidatus Nomurabacteria bacterium RIFCSPLOWO2_12_FULL_46_14]
MDPEDRKLLEETLELTKENNQMLRKVRGVQKRAAIWNIVKVVLIVGIAYGSFYYLEPYVDKIMSLYSSIFSAEGQLKPGSIFENTQR